MEIKSYDCYFQIEYNANNKDSGYRDKLPIFFREDISVP